MGSRLSRKGRRHFGRVDVNLTEVEASEIDVQVILGRVDVIEIDVEASGNDVDVTPGGVDINETDVEASANDVQGLPKTSRCPELTSSYPKRALRCSS